MRYYKQTTNRKTEWENYNVLYLKTHYYYNNSIRIR